MQMNNAAALNPVRVSEVVVDAPLKISIVDFMEILSYEIAEKLKNPTKPFWK
jgi:hypothetical protein